MTTLGINTNQGFMFARFSAGAMDTLLDNDLLPVVYKTVQHMDELPEAARKIVGRWEAEKENGLVYIDGDQADDEEPTHIHIIRFI